MAARSLLNPIALTPAKRLQTLVENRRVYNVNSCELNVFESYEQSYRVPLTFSDFVVTSMVRGKKVMHIFDAPAFDYLPGETVIMPANKTMVIDFPEAKAEQPTQCIALAIGHTYINSTLQYLNEYYHTATDETVNWQLQFDQYHFNNDADMANILNRLIQVCAGDDRAKGVLADLNLKELLVRLLQSQRLLRGKRDMASETNNNRIQFVLHYINAHLMDKILINELCRKAYLSRNAFFIWFREQFGITPVDYINNERMKLAKQMLAEGRYNVSQVSMLCGFSDVNYFVRMFKKVEGITPGAYLACLKHNTLIVS